MQPGSTTAKKRRLVKLTSVDQHVEFLPAQSERGIITDIVRVRENAGPVVGVDVGSLLDSLPPPLSGSKGIRSSVDFKSDGADQIQT